MIQPVKIHGRAIGPGYPCFIIAEAASNHDRDLGKAKALIDAAVEAHADAVKFQVFSAETIAANTRHPIAILNDQFKAHGRTLQELYKNAELPREWTAILAAYARERQITFLSTPFDHPAVDELVALKVPALKIASFEIVDFPLLRKCARTGLPIIMSTGMANMGEVEEAVEVVKAEGSREIALLHCNINYPPPYEEINLRAIDAMREALQLPVGYSDHTTGDHIPIAAVARGACIIEKHFTLSRKKGSGPDHSFSMEPDELARMISRIREVEIALGDGRKRCPPSEEKHRLRGRRSLFYTRNIAAGEVVREPDLIALRPGVGLHTRFMPEIIGRKLARDVRAHDPISWDDFMGERA
jgi:pseudaminic acid synthase